MENTKRILIIDDDTGMLQTMHYILTEKGYDVVTVDNGSDALELLKKEPFDIVLTDIKMPGMSGVDVLERIKVLSPETEVMMITAYTMHDLVEEAKKRGARRIFSKPLDFEEIIPCIEEQANKAVPAVATENESVTELLTMLQQREQDLLEKTRLIDELKRELNEIKKNPSALLEEEKKKRQSENIHELLNPKQLELFKILGQEERSYSEILEIAHQRQLEIRDMSALRLQMSRLEKKLETETNFTIKKFRRNKTLYFTVRRN